MTRIEIDKSGDFARLAKDEEARFFRRGRIAVRTAANRLRKAIRAKLAGGGAGRTYRFRGRSYTASAPGSPPARRTGALIRGYRVSVRIQKQRGSIDGTVQPSPSTTHIARFLEYGTSRMAPRPFVRPAVLETEARLTDDMRTVVEGGET